MTVPFWIEKRVVLAYHAMQLAEHGGSSGIRDEGLLESVLARPQNLAAYASEAPSYYPFVDGNKRTALVVAIAFLVRNGVTFTASQAETYFTFYELTAGHISEEELTAWFEKNSAPAAG
jgi:death-on-curing protein